jgi:DNA-binding transcriptional LysR family regulator
MGPHTKPDNEMASYPPPKRMAIGLGIRKENQCLIAGMIAHGENPVNFIFVMLSIIFSYAFSLSIKIFDVFSRAADMINYNQLRVFYHAARQMSFTEAARRLYITQPAVTAHIKHLEADCSLKLFRKKGRRVFLTDEGKTLFEFARKVFEYEKEIERVIEEMRELKRGVLRLGTTKAYARYFMPFLMSRFHEAYPHIKIHLDEGSSLDMIYSLLDLRNEVAIIAKAGEHPDVNFIPFSQEELVPILSPRHELARKRTIPFKALASEPIIMKEIGSGTRRVVNELFTRNGCIPNVLMETSNTEFIKQLVQRGEGVSFLVRESVALELEEKKLSTVQIKGHKIYLDVSIAYLKDPHLSPPAEAFLEILRGIAPRERPDQGIRTIMAGMLAKWKQAGSLPT